MTSMPLDVHRQFHFRLWKPALLYAIPVSLFTVGLFYYWFAVADRYAIFLYGHLGATPFDDVTRGRYWMTGLVASGAVMVLYTMTNWLLGRVAALCHRGYYPPLWWHVWLFCALPLAVGIPITTMTFNWPTLPPFIAAASTVATLMGLALALTPGTLAAQRPSDLGWLVFDGLGLMPSLLLLRVIELPSKGLISVRTAYLAAVGSTLAGIVWLGIATGLRIWRHKPPPSASALFVAGLCLSYLAMPLVHHLVATPPDYRYISTSSNFFAFNPSVQLLALVVAAILAIGVTRLRQRLQ